jgi:ABC-type uncharacterized transport system permease subunit
MTLVLIAALAYLVATALLARALARDADSHARGWLPLALLGVALHAAFHVQAWRAAAGLDMHFFAALSLVGLGMAALTTLFGAVGRMAARGGGASRRSRTWRLCGLSATAIPKRLDWRLQLHAWCALLAYATLAIAALLALMSVAQERAPARGANSTAGCARCRR